MPHAGRATPGRRRILEALVAARSELGLGDDPYILSVSTLEPRKNHARLVKAFEQLAARRPSIRLVLVGGAGWHSQGLRRSLLESPMADRIHVAGYVRMSALRP